MHNLYALFTFLPKIWIFKLDILKNAFNNICWSFFACVRNCTTVTLSRWHLISAPNRSVCGSLSERRSSWFYAQQIIKCRWINWYILNELMNAYLRNEFVLEFPNIDTYGSCWWVGILVSMEPPWPSLKKQTNKKQFHNWYFYFKKKKHAAILWTVKCGMFYGYIYTE